MAERIILGIDPGTNVMGYGIIKIIKKKAELVTLGVVDMRKTKDTYLTLLEIFNRTTALIEQYLPDEMAIESQFYGKNVQSMLKLGRAQGVAITAALARDIPIHEYAPLKIKMSITGNGRASKEQVAGMLQRVMKISKEQIPKQLDATDALAVAYCHYIESGKPSIEGKKYKNWADFANKNEGRIK